MGAQENKALLKGIFDALATGDGRPFTEAMSDDFRWRFAGDWSWVRDWGQTKEETARNLLAPLMAQFADYRASAEEIIADGDRVVVRASAEARTVGGEPYPQAYCYVFRVRDGRLAEVIEYCDTALVERVLTLPGQSGE
jgi:ketosteroid isomerase-like protein